jgi:hypothetical protein
MADARPRSSDTEIDSVLNHAVGVAATSAMRPTQNSWLGEKRVLYISVIVRG